MRFRPESGRLAGTPPDLDAPGVSLEIHPEASRILALESELLPRFLQSVLHEHHRLLPVKSASVRKDAPESAVTLVDLAGVPRVCVKQFRWRGPSHGLKSLFRPTQGSRAFTNGWRLNEAGFSTATPLALVTRTRLGIVMSEWVVMQVIPHALELDRYLILRITHRWNREEKSGMARLLGRYVGSLHAAGIYHSDLKTCNILVSENEPAAEDVSESGNWHPTNPSRTIRFTLLDYDDVTFSREVPNRKRIKNLVQIFLSMPSAVQASDRFRFLHEYALHVGLSGPERRKLALGVLNAARGKDILYVGFDGDVVEKWDWEKL
ncbi:MAG: hypothetical protein FJY85_21245 [Deltaproteobacteria bacterium]|nr:hypothetical protein [Deltaproteobacteria bacterium]